MIGTARRAMEWMNGALSFLFPEWCQICDAEPAKGEDGYVGDGCRSTVELVKDPFCSKCGRPFRGQITQAFVCGQCSTGEPRPLYEFARSAALAKDALLEAIHLYKYRHALYLEPFLAKLLVQAAEPSITPSAWDIIVPVPLHHRKQREREFNQAERLAKHLSKATRVPLNTRLLRRVSPTRTQTKLTREERFENMKGAFEVRKGEAVNGRRVVIIDDVFTTGATTNACAEALVRQGAASVCVWTVARGT